MAAFNFNTPQTITKAGMVITHVMLDFPNTLGQISYHLVDSNGAMISGSEAMKELSGQAFIDFYNGWTTHQGVYTELATLLGIDPTTMTFSNNGPLH